LALISDCRLALALNRFALVLRRLGFDEVHFSNAYSPRPVRNRRRSRHALGLAIDIHRFRYRGELLDVLRGFPRGQSGPCESRPTLAKLACILSRDRFFNRVLTPDTNADHRDHFHLAILSLDGARFLDRPRKVTSDPD
jgi:hypothetical protein